MKPLNVSIRQAIKAKEEEWVKLAQSLAAALRKEVEEDKAGQLRNIQSIAEQTESWKATELFIRYQAARKQIPYGWAESSAIVKLDGLKDEAKSLIKDMNNDEDLLKQVHITLVARVLGYVVRWHVWDVKEQELKKKEANHG